MFCSAALDIRTSLKASPTGDKNDNKLMASIMGDLPDDIREELYERIAAAMAIKGKATMANMDSQQNHKDGKYQFEAIHFVYYDRSGTKASLLTWKLIML